MRKVVASQKSSNAAIKIMKDTTSVSRKLMLIFHSRLMAALLSQISEFSVYSSTVLIFPRFSCDTETTIKNRAVHMIHP